jgi:protein-disulfide isomerase
VRSRPRPLGVIVIAVILLILGASIGGIALQKPDRHPIVITGASEVQRLLGGIPQDGARLGDDSAPVTVEVFNDLQCPECADYHLQVIDPLISGPVRAGDLKLVFHHFSLSPRETTLASYGAVAAGQQGYQWQFIQLFFLNQDQARQGGVTDEFLSQIAAGILELDQSQFDRDLDSSQVADAVKADANLAAERRLTAQPAVVVTGPRQTITLTDSPSLAEIQDAIQRSGA